MKAERFQDLWPASWRPRRTPGVVPAQAQGLGPGRAPGVDVVQVQRIGTGRAYGVSSSLKASRLKTQEKPGFQFKFESKRRPEIAPLNSQVGGVSLIGTRVTVISLLDIYPKKTKTPIQKDI